MSGNYYPSNTWTDPVNGNIVNFIWIEGQDLSQYEPYTQCYGVCFNSEGEIMVQRKDPQHDWSLPGGTVEEGETAEQTLRREFMEEVDTTLKNVILLGGQKVVFEKGQSQNIKKGVNNFFQLRYCCEVDELQPQTPDPDHGEIRERMFVPQDKIEEYVDWGNPGRAIFSHAKELWKKFHSNH